jgi:hypothetical protein
MSLVKWLIGPALLALAANAQAGEARDRPEDSG